MWNVSPSMIAKLSVFGIASATLSGCSWLGHGNNHQTYNQSHAGHYQAQAPQKPCTSGQCLSRWNVEGGVGPAFLVGGSAVTGDELNAGVDAQINNISMSDAYDTVGYRAEIGTSYALAPNTKATVHGFIQEHDSSGTLDWGTVGDQALTGALSDYRTYGVEAGLRQYAAPMRGIFTKSMRPYIEGKAGVARVDDIDIEGAQLGGQAFAGGVDVPFYDGGWVPTFAGMVGVETPAFRNATIGLETGIRYTGKLDSDTDVLSAGNPLAGSNNGSDSWSIPLTLRGRYRF